jgi:hypothetical protein
LNEVQQHYPHGNTSLIWAARFAGGLEGFRSLSTRMESTTLKKSIFLLDEAVASAIETVPLNKLRIDQSACSLSEQEMQARLIMSL